MYDTLFGTDEQLRIKPQMEVAYVPWGEWFLPTACRKSVQGILEFIAPVFWNVTVTQDHRGAFVEVLCRGPSARRRSRCSAHSRDESGPGTEA